MFDLIEILLLITILITLLGAQKPTSTKTQGSKGKKWVLDTSAIIDGRITELTDNGFAPNELVIPVFIVAELQQLADGRDAHKRERARFGLDVVKRLQDSPYTSVSIDRTDFKEIAEVDDKLVALAKKLNAQLYTTDYNLNKVAIIERVDVLNVNELAQSLRPTALPGEVKAVKIVQKGQGREQGVGYLDDGTMIVVEKASRLIGKTLQVEVTRVHQTVAGKMIFGTLAEYKRS